MKYSNKLVYGAFILSTLMIVLIGYFQITINLTHSMPMGLYIKEDKPLERYDTVTFCLENETFSNLAKVNEYVRMGNCPNGLQALLKVVAGIEGDKIQISGNEILVYSPEGVSKTWSGERKHFDTRGIEMPYSLLENGVIPKGKVLVLTPHKNSFDSRYFGLVESEILTVRRKI